MAKQLPLEQFQPVAIQPPSKNPILFRIRRFFDLQLDTVCSVLQPALGQLSGTVLDVGAGQSPWREWLPVHARYVGIDVENADEFGMSRAGSDVIYYDGNTIPFADAHFDAAFCSEVLEHVPVPEALIAELARVLKDSATLLLTVPWSARRHHIPHDYHRFTPERLHALLDQAGFTEIVIEERGNDVCVIANKLLVLTVRLLRPARKKTLLWSWVPGLLCGVLTAGFMLAAHASLALGAGGKEDPLGYFVKARRAKRP
ncbi:SAM-dependent methyltransferase [Silvimonas terrae]|uniref:SAM-dependent methyltransferase n=1 Tax=Silvimonas terrae TaxID=300266 RepID=A0A840RIE3_9NEIS|nr:class I SAM-dependent methyltransferase [Silvimonas terrae]MBB5192354.1 SAM-dependent methyltransferase [Silvimonas terrae]